MRCLLRAYGSFCTKSKQSDMTKQRVLLLGATGETGGSILEGLLEDKDSFDVEALVRPSSADTPAVKRLVERGVKIQVADIAGDTDELVPILTGVDVFISAIDAVNQLAQLGIVTAAKKAGVKRFVPCAFTTVAPAGGVMYVRDKKEEVYQHIRKLYVPYTIIDVGYWYQISFPTIPSGRIDYAAVLKPKVTIHGDGTTPTMITDLRDIGRFVALIIKDARTLNKSVFTYGEVLSENEIFALTEEVCGEKIERKYVPHVDTVSAREKYAAASANDARALQARMGEDYNYCKYVRGDNTPEHAAYLGYLNARTLYPEFTPRTFRDFLGELLAGTIARPYSG
ncbi:isoflavone reductase family protein [Mycena capillaripes]|nr:isoflavone reductase family protein [Mycena capillaripes]